MAALLKHCNLDGRESGMGIRRFAALLLPTGVAVAVLMASGIGPASAAGPISVNRQMTTIGQSQAAHDSLKLLATELESPALAAYASDLKTQGGSSLTNYQRDLLNVVIDTAKYNDLFGPLLSGTPISPAQLFEYAAFKRTVLSNPAVQLLIFKGAELKADPKTLAADISTVTGSDLGPSSFTGPTGDAAMDAGLQDVATLPDSTEYNTLAGNVNTALQGPGAPLYVASLPPLVVSAFIPGSQSIKFLLPNDHDPAVFEAILGGLGIIAGIGGVIAAIALAPEVLVGAALVGTIAALVAADATILAGELTVYHAYDCDLDGDPGDPADVPGNEC